MKYFLLLLVVLAGCRRTTVDCSEMAATGNKLVSALPTESRVPGGDWQVDPELVDAKNGVRRQVRDAIDTCEVGDYQWESMWCAETAACLAAYFGCLRGRVEACPSPPVVPYVPQTRPVARPPVVRPPDPPPDPNVPEAPHGFD